MVKESVWNLVSVGLPSDVYYGATWSTSTDVTVVGKNFFDGVIVTSHDRGGTWTRSLLPSTPLNDIDSFYYQPNLIFYIAASSLGYVAISNDNAHTWELNQVDSTVAFFGVAIGNNGEFSINDNFSIACII